MTEQDIKIQDLRAENAKLKEQLKEQSKPTEPTDMDKITTEIMEYICDNLCKYPCTCRSEEHLQEVCDECQVEEYLTNIKGLFDGKAGADNG